MALRAEALYPGRRKRLSFLLRGGIDFGELNRYISLAHEHAIPTNRVRVLMEAHTAVTEQGKRLERDDPGLRHGPRQGGPATPIKVLIGENNACVRPTDASDLTKRFGEVLRKHCRCCFIP